MVQRINLYMFRQILIAFLFSGIAVTFVVLFTQSFRLLSFVIDNSSTMVVFVQLMGLMIPTFLPLILPISVGVGVLFIYHKFAIDSEIVVMRAAGMSPMHLAIPALSVAGVAIVGGLCLTLWLTPTANSALTSLQGKVRDEYSAFMIQPGIFNDLAEGLTVFARRRGAEGGLEDILVHDVRLPQTPVTIMAKTGLFRIKDGFPQIVVFEGRRQEIDTKTGHLQQLNFSRYTLDLHLFKDVKKREAEPREMMLGELIAAQNNENLPARIRARAYTEFHQRIAGPLLSMTFALLGVTVILVGDFNRRGMSRRVLLATLFIIVVQAASFGLVSLVGKTGWIVLGLYSVIFLPMIPCVMLLRQEKLSFKSTPPERKEQEAT